MIFQVAIAAGFHLFPFRTEKLSPLAPMVLHTRGRVGSRRFFFHTLEIPPERHTVPEGFSVLGVLLFVFLFLFGLFDIPAESNGLCYFSS